MISYWATRLRERSSPAGIIVTLAALWPPDFLQYLIIFTGAGMACTFLAPMVLGLYWRRATREGALAALLTGFATVAVLWGLGVLGVGADAGQADEVALTRGKVENGEGRGCGSASCL